MKPIIFFTMISLLSLELHAFSLLDITVTDKKILRGVWKELPVKIFIDSYGDLPLISGDNEDEIIEKALLSWAQVETSVFSFKIEGKEVPPYYQVQDFEVTSRDGVNYIIYDRDGSITQRETLADKRDILGFGIPIAAEDTGIIYDSIIVVNGYTVDGDSLQAVMTHEFGHIIGLDHSGITTDDPVNKDGLPTMYPIKVTNMQKSLEMDDKMGLTMLYPDVNTVGAKLGIVTGSVVSDRTKPMFGVHVVAVDAETKEPVVGTFTGFPLDFFNILIQGRGQYILPLPPGNYFLRIESFPIAGYSRQIQDGAIDVGSGIGSNDFLNFDIGFETEYYNNRQYMSQAQTLEVSSGTSLPNIDFETGLNLQIYAFINIKHQFRGDLVITLGIGDYRDPLREISVLENPMEGQDPGEDAVYKVDISEFARYLPPDQEHPWYLKVYDSNPTDTGEVVDFYIVIPGDDIYFGDKVTPYEIPDDGVTYVVSAVNGQIVKNSGDFKLDQSHPDTYSPGCQLQTVPPSRSYPIMFFLVLVFVLFIGYRKAIGNL